MNTSLICKVEGWPLVFGSLCELWEKICNQTPAGHYGGNFLNLNEVRTHQSQNIHLQYKSTWCKERLHSVWNNQLMESRSITGTEKQKMSNWNLQTCEHTPGSTNAAPKGAGFPVKV